MVAGIAFYIAAADVINEEYGMTVLPLGKWQVGRPIMRKCRAIFGRIPPCSFLIRASKREDAMAGYSPVGKKGSAQAMNDAEQGLPRVSVDPVDLHAVSLSLLERMFSAI